MGLIEQSGNIKIYDFPVKADVNKQQEHVEESEKEQQTELYDLVLPSEYERDLENGVRNTISHIAAREENAWVPKKEAPNLIITLERSGPLAFEAVKGFAEANNIALPPTISLNVGRETSLRFYEQNPAHSIQPPEYKNTERLKNPRLKLKQDKMDDQVRNKYKVSLERYHKWLGNDPVTQQLVDQLAEELKKTGQTPDRILLSDDTVESGISTLSTAWIVNAALKKNGSPLLRLTGVRGSLANAHQDFEQIYNEGEETSEKRTELIVESIFTNPNWRYDIVEANFGHIFYGLPDLDKDCLHEFLAEVVKGKVDASGQTVRPLVSMTDFSELAEHIVDLHTRDYKAIGQRLPHITRPDVILRKYISDEEVVSLPMSMQKMMSEAGRQFAVSGSR